MFHSLVGDVNAKSKHFFLEDVLVVAQRAFEKMFPRASGHSLDAAFMVPIAAAAWSS